MINYFYDKGSSEGRYDAQNGLVFVRGIIYQKSNTHKVPQDEKLNFLNGYIYGYKAYLKEKSLKIKNQLKSIEEVNEKDFL